MGFTEFVHETNYPNTRQFIIGFIIVFNTNSEGNELRKVSSNCSSALVGHLIIVCCLYY
jgi:hypothetical protein